MLATDYTSRMLTHSALGCYHSGRMKLTDQIHMEYEGDHYSPRVYYESAMSPDSMGRDNFLQAEYSVRTCNSVESTSTMDYSDQDVTSPSSQGASSDPKRQKVASPGGKSIEEELCKICGDRASGYHYNALSCEGCKGFFRRSVTRGATYNCKYGGHCEMDMWMRRKCQACRLRRCREVGMKEECLLSGEQCKARDARRKSKQHVHKTSGKKQISSVLSPESSSFSSMEEVGCVEKMAASKDLVKEPMSPGTVVERSPIERMSDGHKEIIEKLVYLQDKYELPEDSEVKQISENVPLGPSDGMITITTKEAVWTQLAEMTALVTQLVVNFSKCLPGFSTLCKEDQIILLKACTLEVMTLRTARRYDLDTNAIIMANNVPFTYDNMIDIGMGQFADLTMDFCSSMAKMKVDNAEFAMLTAVCIFSERPGLLDPHKVERCQELYSETLKAYEDIKRYRGTQTFAKLLHKLTDLRSVSIEHAKMMLTVQVDKNDVPPLLTEIFEFRESENIETDHS